MFEFQSYATQLETAVAFTFKMLLCSAVVTAKLPLHTMARQETMLRGWSSIVVLTGGRLEMEFRKELLEDLVTYNSSPSFDH